MLSSDEVESESEKISHANPDTAIVLPIHMIAVPIVWLVRASSYSALDKLTRPFGCTCDASSLVAAASTLGPSSPSARR